MRRCGLVSGRVSDGRRLLLHRRLRRPVRRLSSTHRSGLDNGRRFSGDESRHANGDPVATLRQRHEHSGEWSADHEGDYALRKRLRGCERKRQRDAERGEPGRERRLRTDDRRFHGNDGFSSRSIVRLLETRGFLSMPERATAKALSFWRDEDGSALVEATIVMPLLISLFLGVFEFSWFFYNQQLVVSGLRDAARYMTRIELTDGNRDPCAQKDQYGALYTDDAANIATTAQPSAGGSARVSGWTAADVTISCSSSAALDAGNYADGSTSMTIIDVATRFADPSLGLFASLGLKAPMLSFSHQERFIGPG